MRAALAAAIFCVGCASTPAIPPDAPPATAPGTPPIDPVVVGGGEFNDPLIGFNRAMFAFNDVTYRFLLVPLAKGYRWITPDPVERGIGNFFHNLGTPIYLVNDVLQLEPRPFGRHLSRFVINSTVGLLGFFDPAKDWFGLERTRTGFADTLSDYGSGYGFYLVLPLIGPSDARSGAGRVADWFLNPVPYLTHEPQTTAIQAFDGFQEIAPAADKYPVLRRKVEDPYIFFRNLHLQGLERDDAH